MAHANVAGTRHPTTSYPTTNWWHAKWELSQDMYALRTHSRTFDADLHADSVIIRKISALELRRKFIKGCVVGWV